jgi:hypothetical protein
VFEEGFGFERYVDYVLDVPMYFVYRNGTYHNVAGQSFRDFMDGKLPGLPGAPTLVASCRDVLELRCLSLGVVSASRSGSRGRRARFSGVELHCTLLRKLQLTCLTQ